MDFTAALSHSESCFQQFSTISLFFLIALVNRWTSSHFFCRKTSSFPGLLISWGKFWDASRFEHFSVNTPHGCHWLVTQGSAAAQTGSFVLRTHLAKTALSSALQFWEPILRACYRGLIFRDQASCISCRLMKRCIRNMPFFPPWGWDQCWWPNTTTEPSRKPLFFINPNFKCHPACQLRETPCCSAFGLGDPISQDTVVALTVPHSSQMPMHINVVKRLKKCLMDS